MRAPKRKRPIPNKIDKTLTPAERQGIAKRAKYVGSEEHKAIGSELIINPPRPRADASICPREINSRKIVNEWLKIAIEKGAISEMREGDFPRYVWYMNGDQLFTGRLVNRGLGQYKGYPIERSEGPIDIEKYY